MTHHTLSHAVVYEPLITGNEKSTQTAAEEQRRQQQQQPRPNHDDDRLYMPALGQFKACSLMLGLLVGFFIYLSTLGAEFVGVMLWGREILNKSNHELILFSLLWNFLTTLIAIIILSSMRRLVSVVFLAAHNHRSNNDSHSSRNANVAEDILSELLSYMEGRFAVGALIGICGSWNVTNLVLGMKPQIIQSCIILAVACLWCRVTLVLLGTPERSLIHDETNNTMDDEEEGLKAPLLV